MSHCNQGALRGASLLGVLLLASCGSGDDGSDPPAVAQTEQAACASLNGTTYGDGTTVTSAAFYPGATTIGGTAVNGGFCRVEAQSKPTGDSNIGFELWLPAKADWNGKFQGVGSGGSLGSIGYSAMAGPLAVKYAVMANDNGHTSNLALPNGGSEQTWALGHPEKIVDFGYRAQHVSTVRAKEILAAYYGRAQTKSYFVGCSQGGHHALMEASRYPTDYDGIVAGAPAWQWSHLMAAELWNSISRLRDGPNAITTAKSTLLNQAVIAACDRNDGLIDGLIGDPRLCTYDPAVLQCTGAETATCLTASQVNAAKRIYAGTTQSNGVVIFPPYTRGSEPGWSLYASATPGGSGYDFFRYAIFQDPTFDNANFNFDSDYNRSQATTIAGQLVPTVYDATADLAPFKARGGKLIIYHGWADQQITPLSSVDYYNRVVAQQGTTETSQFLRMFMLPGVQHCAGGPGPQNIGGSNGTPPVADAAHDVVIALDRWATTGVAPDTMIATRTATSTLPVRTRPLCPYPKAAVYNGSGSIDDAASFTCQ